MNLILPQFLVKNLTFLCFEIALHLRAGKVTVVINNKGTINVHAMCAKENMTSYNRKAQVIATACDAAASPSPDTVLR